MSVTKWICTGLMVAAIGLAWLVCRALAKRAGKCPQCDGRGEVPFQCKGYLVWVDCPHCHGKD
jgi:hypothetical protein